MALLAVLAVLAVLDKRDAVWRSIRLLEKRLLLEWRVGLNPWNKPRVGDYRSFRNGGSESSGSSGRVISRQKIG